MEQFIPFSESISNLAVSGDVLALLLWESGGRALHIYRHTAGTWSFEQRIFRADLLQGLDVDGDRVAQGWETPGERGRVLVFRFNGTHWVPEASLSPFPRRPGDELGAAVDIEGNWILAGAPRYPQLGGPSRGSAFAFRYNGGAWIDDARLASSRTSRSVGTSVQLDLATFSTFHSR